MRPQPVLRAGVFAAACILSAAGSGCAAEPDGEDLAEASQGLRGDNKPIPHPAGVYFANVSAKGTGCPLGTWDTVISDDGETFTAMFAAYEAQVSPGQASDAKECQLDIELGSPEGLSYSIASFYYQGYVFLEKEGMTSRQTASYSFRGNGHGRADRDEVKGPADESYVHESQLGGPGQRWSPCRRDDTLHVRTRLEIKNDRRRTGSGYVNSATIDGSLAFQWKLQWRRCRGS